MTTVRTLWLAAVLAAGCSKTSDTAQQPAPPAEPAATPAMAGMGGMGGMGGMMAPDTRAPVPLTAMMANHQKSEMRDHLRVIQEVTVALGKSDWDAIVASAARIGWSEQQAAMCKHMGAGAPGFAERGEAFHHTADGIAEAAKRHDQAGVEAALGATLEACTGCHDAFRQEVVDDADFAKLAGGEAGAMDPSCPMMQGK